MTGNSAAQDLALSKRPDGLLAVTFGAMASRCELLVAESDPVQALRLGRIVATEARRIEARYSRYRPDSIVSQINASRGATLAVDPETAGLLDFAKQCYDLSEGLFDVTSGVLRRVWTFDGSDRVPAETAVRELLPLIGFDKLCWRSPEITLPAGMELDLGGIGKEYAVDRAFGLLVAHTEAPFLVNFGGDLRANRGPHSGPWRVGIERPSADGQADLLLELEQGGLATSGDARRFLLKEGVRYSHILDPRTGWPVHAAPRSVSVAASSCTEAGLLSTLALLHGAGAREFLQSQSVKFWLQL